MSNRTAQVIDQHREAARRVGVGVTVECLCGDTFYGHHSDYDGPMTAENNSHRSAERSHAEHVAEALVEAKVKAVAQTIAKRRAYLRAGGPRPWEWWTPESQEEFRADARSALVVLGEKP